MGHKLGLDAKLYYKVGGVAGAGNWVELTNAKDVTLNLEKGEADVTTRGAQGWRLTAATLKEASIEWEMQWDTGDAGFSAVKDAYFNNSVIGLRALDGENGEGLEGDFDIFNFTRNEPLEEALTVSVSAKPTYSATAPTWKEAGA